MLLHRSDSEIATTAGGRRRRWRPHTALNFGFSILLIVSAFVAANNRASEHIALWILWSGAALFALSTVVALSRTIIASGWTMLPSSSDVVVVLPPVPE